MASKKTNLIIIAGAAVLLLAAGGGYVLTRKDKPAESNTTTSSQSVKQPTEPALTINELTDKIKSTGLPAEPKSVYYQAIGAVDGAKVAVNNAAATVEYYKFADSQKKNDGKAQLEAGGASTIYDKNNVIVVIDGAGGYQDAATAETIAKIKAAVNQ